MPAPGSHLEANTFSLTRRQREVMRLLDDGRTNFEIARELGLTLDGAKYHVGEILGRLGVDSREAAVARWREATAPPSLLRRGLGALTTATALKVAAAAIAGIAAIGAVAPILTMDDDPPAAPDPTAALVPNSTPAPSPTVGRAPTSVPTPNRPKGPETLWRWEWPEPSANLFLTADEDAVAVSGSGPIDASVEAYQPAPGRIVLLDSQSGAERWAFDTPARPYPALLTPALVVAGTADGTVYALDRATGDELWRLDFPATPYTILDAADTFLIAPHRSGTWIPRPLFNPELSFGSTIWAVDAATGEQLWEEANAVDDDGTHFASTAPGLTLVERTSPRPSIARRDPRTGADLWHAGVPFLVTPPTIAHDLVWLAGPDGELLALDLATGAERWRSSAADREPYTSALPADGGVVFSSSTAIDLWGPDGSHVWHEESAVCQELESHRYLGESGGALFVHACRGVLVILPFVGGDPWLAPQGPVKAAAALSVQVVIATSIGGEAPTFVVAYATP